MPTPAELEAFKQRMIGKAASPTGTLSFLGGVANPMAPMLVTGAQETANAIAPPSSLPPGAPSGIVQQSPPPPTQLSPIAGSGGDGSNFQLSPTLSQLGSPAQAPGLAGMGGGGSPTGGLADLKARWQQAQQRQIQDFNTQKDTQEGLGDERAKAVEGNAHFAEMYAAGQQKMAEDQAQVDQDAAAKHQQFLQRNQELADQIGAMKVDPDRVFRKSSNGEKFLYALGNALGNFVEGFSGGAVKNSYAAQLDKIIDRDIAAQQDEISTKKAQLGARQSLFGQMLQETGDQRLAAMQTRNLMLESGKQWLQAQSDRLQIPSMQMENQLKIDAITQMQSGLDEAIKKSSYATALQQAQAAAAARAAAEREAWNRRMQLAELGLKRDELTIKAAAAGKEEGDKTDAQVAELSKRLADKDLADGRAAIDNAKRRLAMTDANGNVITDASGNPVLDPNKGLPGVGKLGDLRAELGPGGKLYGLPSAAIADRVVGLSPEERVSRGDWDKIKLAYQKQITGSGASLEERKMISQAFEGARTPQEQANAVAQADAMFRQIESRDRAGYSPKVNSIVDARLKAQGAVMPGSVKVTGGAGSDERMKRFATKLGAKY